MEYTLQPSAALQTLHLNNLKSGRMKAFNTRILVDVGNSTNPSQRLMLKYSPGAAVPFINSSTQTQVWNKFYPHVQPESHNLLQCSTFQFQSYIPSIFPCQDQWRLAGFSAMIIHSENTQQNPTAQTQRSKSSYVPQD